MEFPFGHHHHHHRHPENPEEENPNTYPPPGHRPHSDYPPPGHRPHSDYDQPPPPHRPPPPQDYYADASDGRSDYGFAPPPPFSGVQHVSHVVGGEGGEGGYGYGHPHRPEFSSSHVQHVGHEGGGGGIPRQPTVRVFTKAEENYSLSIRDGNVVLVRSNPSDEFQHWIKDMRYSTKVKDEEGFPSFALINKVTGEALKHSIGPTRPVRLVQYNPEYLDESVLWTESNDVGDGFRCIRMVNNIRLNFDAFHGDEDHGGVRDGTTVVLWEWLKGKNQRWKIIPY